MSPTRGSQKRPKVVEGWRYGSGRAFQGKVEVWFFDDNRSSKVSAGVLQPRVLRGRLLRAAATAARSSAVCLLRSVPFGKYCLTQAVGVFVRAALPRALRVAEVDGQASVDAQPCVLSHLCSLVPCQRPAELLGQGRDRRSDRVPDGFGTVSSQRWTVLGPGLVVFVKAGEVEQRREPGGPLDQRSDRRTAQPQDQVAFPVPGNGAVVCPRPAAR